MKTLIALQQGVGGRRAGGGAGMGWPWGQERPGPTGPREPETRTKVTPLTVFRIRSNLFCQYQPLLFRTR
jgi:hypothetical protein